MPKDLGTHPHRACISVEQHECALFIGNKRVLTSGAVFNEDLRENFEGEMTQNPAPLPSQW